MKHRMCFNILTSTMHLLFFFTLTAFPSGFLFAESKDFVTDTSLMNGLVSYWPLDEGSGVREDVKGGNNLADNNTVLSATGLYSLAADFERGSNVYGNTPDPAEYLSIADSVQSNLDITGSISVSAWVKVEDAPPSIDDSYTIASKASEAEGQWSWVFRYGHWNNVMPGERHLDFIWKENSGTWDPNGWDTHKMVAINNLESGSFHLVTITVNVATQELKFYVDGMQVGETQQGPNSLFNSSASFLIGGYGEGAPTTVFDGLIDEVGLWNRALTAEEVSRLYNEGKGLVYELEEEMSEGCEGLSIKECFAKLRVEIKETNLPKIKKSWLFMRVALAEKLFEKKGKGCEKVTLTILETVSRTLEKWTPRYISEEDANELQVLISEIRTRVEEEGCGNKSPCKHQHHHTPCPNKP